MLSFKEFCHLCESTNSEYHNQGTIQTNEEQPKKFSIKFDGDRPGKNEIADQNKHLTPSQIQAIHDHHNSNDEGHFNGKAVKHENRDTHRRSIAFHHSIPIRANVHIVKMHDMDTMSK